MSPYPEFLILLNEDSQQRHQVPGHGVTGARRLGVTMEIAVSRVRGAVDVQHAHGLDLEEYSNLLS